MSSHLVIALATGSGLALLASAHCALMCGPIAMLAHARGAGGGTARYLLGRLVSYTLLGSLAGSVGKVLATHVFVRWAEAGLSWVLAFMLASAALRLVRNQSQPALLSIGRRPRQSLVARWLAHVAHEPLLLGAATALLPCAALFGALAAAAALGSAGAGALALATFSLLSGLAVVGVGQLGRVLSLGKQGRRGLALALLAGALITAWRPLASLADPHAPVSCPLHAEVR